MISKEIISWLLEGDVAIQYQTHRDLFGVDDPKLQKRIATEGWGKQFLVVQNKNGHWGKGFYQPKWTCSHYTLLDLKNLAIQPENDRIQNIITSILLNEKGADGGINPSGIIKQSDVCINGMFLNYACYFNIAEELLRSVVDFLLSQTMKDGGFNCQSNRKGASHSSMHSTLSVVEGISEYEKNGYRYRLGELMMAKNTSIDFILMHNLFRSDHTDKIINPNFLKFHYPARWYYDILRAMDYFQYADVRYDKRMEDAILFIKQRQTKDGKWKLPAQYPGLLHFEMEKPGAASRWNTLRALRVLKFFFPDGY